MNVINFVKSLLIVQRLTFSEDRFPVEDVICVYVDLSN